jgi:hypothetical protein
MAILWRHSDPINGIDLSPDGARVVMATNDRVIRMADSSTGVTILEMRGHLGPIQSVEFSRDGDRIVTASSDQTVRIWDSRSGAELVKLTGHTNSVLHASFNQAGTQIVSSSSDGTVRVWDATWAVAWRGDELARRVCKNLLIDDTKLFQTGDTSDPILAGLAGTSPYERRGVFSTAYWSRQWDTLLSEASRQNPPIGSR